MRTIITLSGHTPIKGTIKHVLKDEYDDIHFFTMDLSSCS